VKTLAEFIVAEREQQSVANIEKLNVLCSACKREPLTVTHPGPWRDEV
jgi:hypothetical protein